VAHSLRRPAQRLGRPVAASALLSKPITEQAASDGLFGRRVDD
jgi:hypothetical protein